MHKDPIPIKELENSVVVFDDIGVVSDKKIREAVYAMLSQILEIGGHFRISCLVTSHLPSSR